MGIVQISSTASTKYNLKLSYVWFYQSKSSQVFRIHRGIYEFSHDITSLSESGVSIPCAGRKPSHTFMHIYFGVKY